MTAAENQCDICGGKEHFVGVASSSTGPISIGFCGICLGMRAEPKAFIDMIYDPEMGNFRSEYPKEAWCYYDKDQDAYINYGTGLIMDIEFKDGKKFNHRKEAVEHLETLKKEHDKDE